MSHAKLIKNLGLGTLLVLSIFFGFERTMTGAAVIIILQLGQIGTSLEKRER